MKVFKETMRVTLILLMWEAITCQVAQAEEAVKTDELQQTIKVQQEQLDAQQHSIQELQRQVQELGAPAKPSTTKSPTTTRAQQTPTSAEQAMYKKEVLMFEKLTSDPRNQRYVKGDEGWKSVPDSKTALKFGGFVQLNLIHSFQDAGYPYGQFIPSIIPVPTDTTPDTQFDLRSTRLTFETKTKNTKVGNINSFISIDFSGNVQQNAIQPRLRQAYVSGIGFFSRAAILAGQANSTFMDLQAFPDQFDLEGPNSAIAIRQGLLRYSLSVNKARSLVVDLALEQPETAVQNGNGLRDVPDFVSRLNWKHAWGHLNGAVLLRQLVAESNAGTGKDSAFGWGLTFSGQVKVAKTKDNFQFQVTSGTGIGRYIQDLASDANGQDAVYNDTTNELTPLDMIGGYAAYQHWWTGKLRSTLVGGYLSIDNLAIQPDEAFNKTVYSSLNLIFRPYKHMDFGGEYYWGERTNKNDQAGHANRLMVTMKYGF